MRTTLIGLLLPHGLSYYRHVLLGIRRYAETQPRWHFSYVEFSRPSLSDRTGRSLDGLIAAVNTPELAQTLARWRRPIVSVSAVLLPPPPYPWVGVNNGEIGRLVAEHFLDRGLRQFGFVGSSRTFYSTQREAAFRQAVEARGYRVAAHHDDAWQFDPEAYRMPLDRRVYRWLRSLPKPVGILAPTDLWGMRLVEACREIGLRVPEDISAVGVDNDELFCELCRPTLSSVKVPGEQIGQEAAALLDRLMAGAEAPKQPLLLPPPGLVVRQSSDALVIDDAEVVAAVRSIREHTGRPLRVADVILEVSIGRRSLERRFRKALGHGVAQEIRRTQMARAKRLLAETDLKVSAIAQQSGFYDARHMALVFRKELGMSASAFRQRMREPC